jgi:pimeloyl-ACP methyl ester carboxylesterase
MKHTLVRANGAAFHTVKTGRGAPLLLLHGWPEFWLTSFRIAKSRIAPPPKLPLFLRGLAGDEPLANPHSSPDFGSAVSKKTVQSDQPVHRAKSFGFCLAECEC